MVVAVVGTLVLYGPHANRCGYQLGLQGLGHYPFLIAPFAAMPPPPHLQAAHKGLRAREEALLTPGTPSHKDSFRLL